MLNNVPSSVRTTLRAETQIAFSLELADISSSVLFYECQTSSLGKVQCLDCHLCLNCDTAHNGPLRDYQDSVAGKASVPMVINSCFRSLAGKDRMY